MAREWYILATYSGYENKIQRDIKTLIERGTISPEVVTDIVVPEETVVEKGKNGKNKNKKKNFLPGYLLIEMDLSMGTAALSDPSKDWREIIAKIRRIVGVNGFLGTETGAKTSKPLPIDPEEAKQILQKTGEIKTDKASLASYSFSQGDKVKIMDGPFATFSGTVGEIMPDRNKLRVMVSIFGRETPVEVEASQVELI